MSANSTNNRVSSLVNTQVPFFVRNDHELFVKFIEKYYEYLEQNEKAIGRAKKLLDYRDIDNTIDEFAEYIYAEFMKILPRDMLADKALVLKHIKDFYRARGTEKSIRFLLRILYGDLADDVTFYYPKRHILRVSDGKWFIEKSLRLTDVKIDGVANNDPLAVQKFVNSRIRGNTSSATALVERIEKYYEGGSLIQELKISNQVRNFTSGEAIYANYDDEDGTHLIQANTFSGILNTITILNAGSGYQIGDEAVIESNVGGEGGSIVVTDVSEGGIATIGVAMIGAGFQVNNEIEFTGGDGSGTNAHVASVNTSGYFHPNTYNIVSSIISLEANTPIGNAVYSNLVSSVSDPANNSIANSMQTFVYANTGPLITITVTDEGSAYSMYPEAGVRANTRVRELGILGLMTIENAGRNYTTNDTIEFQNVPGGYGTGARANVTSVNANGSIMTVKFQKEPGHHIGGSGYTQDHLPHANVVTSTGTGANVMVRAVLGDGEELVVFGGTVGAIQELTIVNRGQGYTEAPYINLKSIGDGTAQANVTIITGVFSYPGRYLNDDGKPSSFNFLQDEHYYQGFSYVVRSRVSIEKYRSFMKDLTHPAGLKLFAEFPTETEACANNKDFQAATQYNQVLYTGSFRSSGRPSTNSSNVVITLTKNLSSMNGNAYIEFATSNNANSVHEDKIYRVLSTNVSANSFTVNAAGLVVNSNGSVITSI